MRECQGDRTREHLIHGISDAAGRQAIVDSIVAHAHRLGVAVIAEESRR